MSQSRPVCRSRSTELVSLKVEPAGYNRARDLTEILPERDRWGAVMNDPQDDVIEFQHAAVEGTVGNIQALIGVLRAASNNPEQLTIGEFGRAVYAIHAELNIMAGQVDQLVREEGQAYGDKIGAQPITVIPTHKPIR